MTENGHREIRGASYPKYNYVEERVASCVRIVYPPPLIPTPRKRHGVENKLDSKKRGRGPVAKKTKTGSARGPKTDMFVRAITTAINSMGGGLRQRYGTKLVEKAISTLGEGASRYELRDWMDANDPPVVRVVGGGKRARRQRDVARRLILDSWSDFTGGKTDLKNREDLTPLGQCLVKYYQTTFAPDAPTLSDDDVEYLAIGSPPKEGIGRKKSFARWEGGARVRLPSHRNATKVSDLAAADFKTLFPRRAAWVELVMTASK